MVFEDERGKLGVAHQIPSGPKLAQDAERELLMPRAWLKQHDGRARDPALDQREGPFDGERDLVSGDLRMRGFVEMRRSPNTTGDTVRRLPFH